MRDDKWISNGIVAGVFAGIVFAFFVILDEMSRNLGALIGMPTRLGGIITLFIATLISGFIFAFILGRLIHSWSSSLAWGLLFGLVLWLLGPMTLLPLLTKSNSLFSQWSYSGLHAHFSLLIGYLLYGLILGLSYCFLKKGKLHKLKRPKNPA